MLNHVSYHVCCWCPLLVLYSDIYLLILELNGVMTPDACDILPRYLLGLLECVCQVNLGVREIRYVSGVTFTILSQAPTHQVRISEYIGPEWSYDTRCMWLSHYFILITILVWLIFNTVMRVSTGVDYHETESTIPFTMSACYIHVMHVIPYGIYVK